MTVVDIVSTSGVSLILAGFVLNTFDIIEEKSKLFFLLNIIGAGLAGWGAYLLGSIPFLVLETVWVLVGIWGLLRLWCHPEDHSG